MLSQSSFATLVDLSAMKVGAPIVQQTLSTTKVNKAKKASRKILIIPCVP